MRQIIAVNIDLYYPHDFQCIVENRTLLYILFNYLCSYPVNAVNDRIKDLNVMKLERNNISHARYLTVINGQINHIFDGFRY